MKSCLKWHGGKYYLADTIIGMFPKREKFTHYAEPFFGGGSVLLKLNSVHVSETINDINGHLMNFWKVLQKEETMLELARLSRMTPFSEVEFLEARQYISEHPINPEEGVSVEAAWRFFIMNRMCRQGLHKSYATPTKRIRRNMNENVSAWLSAVDELPDIYQRLRRVEVRCMDFEKFIAAYDHPKCLFYIDCPYLHETRTATKAYEYEMTEEDHVRLLNQLTTLKGKFILSGYPSDLYQEHAYTHRWKVRVVDIDNKASSAKKKEIKHECIWTNFACCNNNWDISAGRPRRAKNSLGKDN